MPPDSPAFGPPPDSLAGNDAATWERRIEAVGVPALLVAVNSRLGPALRLQVAPEDVLQDALLLAWRDRARCEWRGLRPFRRWLLTVVENHVRHLAAASATERRGSGKAPLPFSALSRSAGSTADSEAGFASRIGLAASGTPSRVASRREEAAAIEEALASLDDDVRDVVRLRLIEELELVDVATRCGIGVEAARHRFRRGMESYRLRVRRRLADHSACASSTPSGDPAPR